MADYRALSLLGLGPVRSGILPANSRLSRIERRVSLQVEAASIHASCVAMGADRMLPWHVSWQSWDAGDPTCCEEAGTGA